MTSPLEVTPGMIWDLTTQYPTVLPADWPFPGSLATGQQP